MKYVKGALIVGEREIMVELPSDWRISIGTEKFLMCKSYAGEDTAFNTSMIFNVREVSETVWKNWLTRMAMVKEKLQEEALKKAEVSKE
jgi:hypothetical protein